MRELTYAQDPHGNVSMLISEAGATKASYGYTAYGEADTALTAEKLPGSDQDPTAGSRSTRSATRQAREQLRDDRYGRAAVRPGPGQFLQEDRFDGALEDVDARDRSADGNRFALAGGNPVSFVELDGHCRSSRTVRRRGP